MARAVVSSKLQRRNGFELQIAVADGRAAIGFAVNDRLISGYSITWGPRLTVAVPSTAEVYIRTTTGDVLVTGLGSSAGKAAVFVESVAGMVVVQDSAADVRLVSGEGDLVVRRVTGDVASVHHVASGAASRQISTATSSLPTAAAASAHTQQRARSDSPTSTAPSPSNRGMARRLSGTTSTRFRPRRHCRSAPRAFRRSLSGETKRPGGAAEDARAQSWSRARSPWKVRSRPASSSSVSGLSRLIAPITFRTTHVITNA